MGHVVIDVASEYHHTCSNDDDEEKSERSQLVSSLKEELQKLPPLSSECCIYRIPERLRKQNPQAYTPHLVSIGPYHYNNKEDYANMEVDKRRYLQKFLARTGMSLEKAVDFIKERETRIRNSYEQSIDHLSSNELVRMVLLDAVFAFIYILCGPEELRVEHDRVFGGGGASSSREEMGLDMLLLENQIPFFIFVDLSKLVLKESVLTEAAKHSTCIYKQCYETLFVCIIKSSNLPMDIDKAGTKHIIDFLRHCLLPSVRLPCSHAYDYELVVPTLTELHEAGVKLKVASSVCSLLDLQFSTSGGVLTIPHIGVDFRTETLFRNLLAFEQCHCQDLYLSEYMGFMASLIKSPKDVELLIRYKIMVNNHGDNEAVSTLFNNLAKGLVSNVDNYYFGTISEDLVAYRDTPYHSWKATLKHDYFSNPWKSLSVVAAIFLLLLTLTQTVFSILSFKH